MRTQNLTIEIGQMQNINLARGINCVRCSASGAMYLVLVLFVLVRCIYNIQDNFTSIYMNVYVYIYIYMYIFYTFIYMYACIVYRYMYS